MAVDRRAQRGFTLIELMMVVAIIAILAVVAVPQFTKYMRSAKAAEAVQMLDVIKKGSAAYYAVARTTEGGAQVPCQFPAAAGVTPAGTSCCDDQNDADGDDRCDSATTPWDHPTWSALRFAITDHHFFQYAYESAGVLDKATMIATAHADLDCDGITSTFELVARGDPKATEGECDAVTASGFFRDNETE